MFFFILVLLYPIAAWSALVPDLATVESCTNWHIMVNDRNVRKAIEFFRSCRNLGLTMGDLLPDDYMMKLATNLKTSNYQFLQQTILPQPKLRMLEREFNDLYQEITILSEKVVGTYRKFHDVLGSKRCTCTETKTSFAAKTPTSTTPPTTTKCIDESVFEELSTMMPGINQEDSNRMDPFDYDYGSSINACSEAAFYIYLLAIAILSLLISLWTCRLASKTYKLLKDSQIEDEDIQYNYSPVKESH